jgi:hypothetical protein
MMLDRPFAEFGGMIGGGTATFGPAAVAGPVLSAGTGLTFTLKDTGGVTLGSQAEAGFQKAAALWSSFLSDPINVRLNVGFSSLGGNTLAQAGSNSAVVSFAVVRSALIADQTSSDDGTAVASLGSGSSLSFFTNNQAGTRIFDNDGSANNTFLDVNTANLRALGITIDANGDLVDDGFSADADITFNSDFTFDFDPSDGIGADAIDFVGVSFHEIGHSLGFVSGVDTVDYYSGFGQGARLDLNPYAIFSTLDLFRYSGNGTRDLSFGGATYFSINGGQLIAACHHRPLSRRPHHREPIGRRLRLHLKRRPDDPRSPGDNLAGLWTSPPPARSACASAATPARQMSLAPRPPYPRRIVPMRFDSQGSVAPPPRNDGAGRKMDGGVSLQPMKQPA